MASEGRSASGDTATGGPILYRYADADGRLVFVDSLARVPERLRSTAQPLQLEPRSVESRPAPEGWTRPLDMPSFVAGAGAGVFGALLWVLLWRRSRRLASAALAAAALLLGVGAYLGWIGRITGRSDAALTTPRALIDDARAVVEAMNRRNAEQRRLLDEIAAER